jgi:hypothetical protein
VNHEARREQAPAGDDGLARGQPVGQERAPDFAALLQNAGAARAVNRPVNPAAAEQGGVRGVDHGVHVLARDVAHERAHAAAKKTLCGFFGHHNNSAG